MKRIRRGVIGVVFRRTRKDVKFLLLKRSRGWRGWEFPKGGVDGGETERKAVLREVKEETGLGRIKIAGRFPTTIKYNYPQKSHWNGLFDGTSQRPFLVECLGGRVRPERGFFSGYAWLEAKEATNRLRWDNQRKLVRIALKAAGPKV